MAYDYDKLYRDTPDALGAPTPLIVQAFARFKGQGLRVLDVGCGQGRDAVFIARDGHAVTGVDLSQAGVDAMLAAGEAEGLKISGIAADIVTYEPDGLFHVVLIDRTLHMLPMPARHAVLARLLDHVTESGWVLIADEASNMAGFLSVLEDHAVAWHQDYHKRGYLFAYRD